MLHSWSSFADSFYILREDSGCRIFLFAMASRRVSRFSKDLGGTQRWRRPWRGEKYLSTGWFSEGVSSAQPALAAVEQQARRTVTSAAMLFSLHVPYRRFDHSSRSAIGGSIYSAESPARSSRNLCSQPSIPCQSVLKRGEIRAQSKRNLR